MSNRSFKIGRQSEQLYNDELYKIYESIKTLLEPGSIEDGPPSELHGSLWLRQDTNEMFSYDKNEQAWNILFKNKFQITDQLLSEETPPSPVFGQLWIHQGMLWYHDGMEWKMVYAHNPEDEDGVQNLVNENFLMLNSLTPANNQVVNEEYSQFLVPGTNKGRLYRKDKVDTSYVRDSQIAIQVRQDNLEDHHTWVHTGPARLVDIKKRVIRIDKATAYYEVPGTSTEFFGYKSGSPLGEFLYPKSDKVPDGQYQTHRKGIILSEEAVEKYDFLLAVEYVFSWQRERGFIKHGELKQERMGYFLGRHHNSINVFVEGYDLESTEFNYDSYSKTLQTKDESISAEANKGKKYEMSFLRSIKNEYGFIRKVRDGKGIIKLRNPFKNPLFIVAGQAMNRTSGDLDFGRIDEGIVGVLGAREGMSYSVIELRDDKEKIFIEGMTTKDAITGEVYIEVDDLTNFVPFNEGLLLFVDGILVKKEDIVRDYDRNIVQVSGLSRNQEFILIRDRYHDLYHENHVYPAYEVPRTDESMVFMNGYLLNNDSSILTYVERSEYTGMHHNEVRAFAILNNERLVDVEYVYWNAATQKWIDCTEEEKQGIKSFCFSYDNGLNSIALRVDRSNEDLVEYWVYQFASTVEHPIRVYNKILAEKEIEEMWENPIEFDGKKYIEIKTSERFPFGANALQVYLDGVRLYDHNDMDPRYRDGFENIGILESEEGDGFYLPFKHYGTISYVIERPEEGREKTCEREILTQINRTDMPGVYRTKTNMFPGIVTVYINGQRQSRESFIVLDNHTLLLKDRMVPVGHGIGGKRDEIMLGDDVVVIDYEKEDYILIEVRRDMTRIEKQIIHVDTPESAAKRRHNRIEFSCDSDKFSRSILRTKDEILIYINGLFTGYKIDEGYRKDHSAASIVILAEDFQNRIYRDSIYEMLENDPVLRREWIRENGSIDRELVNTFILEWR